MSSAPPNHAPRITATTPPRTQTITARNAAAQAIRIANIATGPQRGGVESGGIPHDGQTRSLASYPLPHRSQTGIRISWQKYQLRLPSSIGCLTPATASLTI